MSDLLDIARPIRDAAVAETLRAMSEEALPATRDGGVLAAHMIAVMMAWGTSRHDVMRGNVRDPDLLSALSYAVGLLVGNAGMIYRPTVNGEALAPTRSVGLMIQHLVPVALQLAAAIENGCADVSLPIGRQADGTLGRESFDVLAMLKEPKP